MSWLIIIIPLLLSLIVQFLLWFNLLLPYNSLFENFDRSLYFAFSLSGFFGACISVVFYRLTVLVEAEKKIVFFAAIAFQVFCVLSCLFFFLSSLTGWLVI